MSFLSSSKWNIDSVLETFLEKICLAKRSSLLPHPEKLVPSSPSSPSATSSMYLLVFIFYPYFLCLLTVKAEVKSVIYNEVAGAELRSTVSFRPFSLPPSLMSLRYNDIGQPRPLLLSIHPPRGLRLRTSFRHRMKYLTEYIFLIFPFSYDITPISSSISFSSIVLSNLTVSRILYINDGDD